MKPKIPKSEDGQATRTTDLMTITRISEFLPGTAFACPQGHRIAEKGEILRKRFIIQEMLGEGVYSKVWRAQDIKHGENVAIKIVRNSQGYEIAAQREINMLKTVAQMSSSTGSSPPIAQLLNSFKIPGGFVCLVFDQLGKSLLSLLERRNNTIYFRFIKSIAGQLLEALDFLHTECNIIHSDLKPENILLKRDQSESVLLQLKDMGVDLSTIDAGPVSSVRPRAKSTRISKRKKCFCCTSNECETYTTGSRIAKPRDGLKSRTEKALPENRTEASKVTGASVVQINVVDFGTSFHVTDQHRYIQTREYRCPEAILECEESFSPTVDVWSAACITVEVWTGELLFRTVEMAPDGGYHHDSPNCIERDVAHLIAISELLGPIPTSMITKCKPILDKVRNRFAHVNQRHTIEQYLRLKYIQYNGRMDSSIEVEIQRFANFLEPMLALNPAERATAAGCLRHPWLNV